MSFREGKEANGIGRKTHTCREFLICDDSTLKRICWGMGQLEAMRHAGFARLGDSPEFRQLWCGEPKSVDDNFNTKNLLKLGAGSMTDHPWRFREIHQVILNPTHIQKVINPRSDSLRRQSGVKSYRQ